MQKGKMVQYFYDKTTSTELILCSNSVISYPLHNHVSMVVIGFVLRGAISLTADGDARTYEKGSSFMILPYKPHMLEAKAPYSLLTLCINKDSIKNCNKDELRKNICHLLDAASEWKLTKTQIVRLFEYLDLCRKKLPLCADERCIDLIKKQLECHPEMKVGIDEMAQAAYISKYHFIRSFKREVGLTPHQFQIQNRIRKAQRMLNNTDSIIEVALAAGFCDQSHFIKQFERYVGMTPSAYKISCNFLP